MHEDLQGFVVLDQVKDTENTDNTKYEDGFQYGPVHAHTAVTVCQQQNNLHVQRQQSQDVYQVHWGPEELIFVRCEYNAHNDLKGEECCAYIVQVIEEVHGCLYWGRQCVVITRQRCGLQFIHLWKSLQTEATYGSQHEYEGSDCIRLQTNIMIYGNFNKGKRMD